MNLQKESNEVLKKVIILGIIYCLRKMKNSCFAALLFVVFAFQLSAQNQRSFRSLSVKDGLSQSEVTGIAQDREGFMWFSTTFGLNKYDGYTISIYNKDRQGIYEVPYYAYYDVVSDKKGNLYVAGDNLMKYNWKTNRFVVVPNLPKIREMHIDNQGSVWFVSLNYSDACFIDSAGKNFRQFTHDPNNNKSIQGKIVTSMFIDGKERLWVGFDDIPGVSCLYLENYYKQEKKAEFLYYPTRGKVTVIYTSAGRTMFVDHLGNLYRYDETQKTPVLVTDAFAGYVVTSAIEDVKGNVWFATANQGLLLWNPVLRMRFNYNTGNSNLPSNFIRRLYLDRSGVLWMSTANGIAYTDTYAKLFNTYRYIPGYSKSLPEKSVIGVGCDEKGILWVSTDKGLALINEKNDEVKLHRQIFPEGINRHLEDAKITSLVPYVEGSMIAAGQEVNILNPEQKSVLFTVPDIQETLDKEKWAGTLVHYGRTTGNYWIGSKNAGLFCINDPSYASLPYGSLGRMSEKVIRYSWITEVSKEAIWALWEDNEGILWIGSSVGLVAYNTNDNTSELFLNNPNDPNSLSHNSVRCLYQDSRGLLWVGTEAAGVNVFNKKTRKFVRYSTADGLCNNNITGILEDKKARMWISTRNGLSCFDPNTKVFKNYNYSHGLPSNEFNYFAFCRTRDGRLCFGTADGLVSFIPDSITDNPVPPRTLITKLYLYNKEVNVNEKVKGKIILAKPVHQTESIELLEHRHKILSIEFAAIHYAAPEMIQYAYKLEGFDHDWRYTTAINRVAHYTNLGAKNYTFRVKACNLDGIWDETGASLQIHVLPPFWKTWWFRIFMVILLVASVFLIFYGRLKQIEYQKKKLQELVDKQTEEIREKAKSLELANEQLKIQQQELQETNVQLEEKHEEINAQKEELAHQAEELRKANATKDKFFSIIGHDLRNPMYAINGLAKMLKEGGVEMDKAQLMEIYTMLEQSSAGVVALLENLLTWARAQSGRVDYKPEKFDLSEVVASTIQVLRMNAENKGLKLTSEVSPNTMVYADKNMVTTIVRNLINNSIKFTKEGGVTVLCSDENGMKKVVVKDTGIGMTEEVKNKLFRIDVHHTTQGTSGEAGTGLGLIICKEFVEINRGKIWVESEPGKGSSFIFTLPVPVM